MLRTVLARHREFLLYCLIGCSGVALDCAVFAVLTCWAGCHYQMANAVSVSCGIVNNFLWNAFVNFRTADRLGVRFLSFYVIGLLGLGISASLLWLLVGGLGWHKFLAKSVTLVVVMAIQFTLNKHLTFRSCHA